MKKCTELLNRDFVIVDLGASHPVGSLNLDPDIRKATTLLEIDALPNIQMSNQSYYKRITIEKAISRVSEHRTFFKRKFPQCSSFLEPNKDVVTSYGLEEFFKLEEEIKLDCISLQSLLRETGIGGIDYLKTDLEGVDFEVLTSAPDIISRTLVIQCELRFQPNYIGEPSFYETVEYLSKLGFDIITMHPETWKYKTPHRDLVRDGRLVWADVVFFLGQKKIEEVFDTQPQIAFVKQIILAKALGLHNYAEWIYVQIKQKLSKDLSNELALFVKPPSGKLGFYIRSMNTLASLPWGEKVLRRINKELTDLAKATALSKKFPHVGTL